MNCTHIDCFTCPYADCIADTTQEAQGKGEEKNKKPSNKKGAGEIKRKRGRPAIKPKVDKERQKELNRKYNRDYYRLHRTEIRRKRREKYLENASKVKEYQKAYYREHAAEICQKQKDKRKARREAKKTG